MTATTTFEIRAQQLDANDPCAMYRDWFHVPENKVYLDGNSLGLMPKSCVQRLSVVAQSEWSEGLIASWTRAQWFDLPLKVGDRLAPLLGVGRGEVVVGDSTSVNLFKCMAAALHLRPERKVILAESDNFPTDSYMAQGLANLIDAVEVKYFDAETDPAALADNAAIVVLSHIHYRNARVRDMAQVTKAIQAKGALVLWDLSHTTGAFDCQLNQVNADMAVGCTYKYLNGGPGAPAFTWINKQHMTDLVQPLSGWMGHASPFDFDREYVAANGPRRLLCGTPQVLSLSAVDEALKLWTEVDLNALWEKRQLMSSLFIDAVESLCDSHDLQLESPREPRYRGSHVAFFMAEHGYEVMQALIARGVVGDFRAPGTLRFGFAPLYLRYRDVLAAVQNLAAVLDHQEWNKPQFRNRSVVT